MAKSSPEESVMRYFETQPIEKAEVMLSIAKSIVKKRFSAPVDTNQKTYINPSSKKTNMYAKAVQATTPPQAPFQHASPGENPGVDGSVYPSYSGQLSSLFVSDAEFKKMDEGLDEKEKKAKKKPEPEEIPF